MGIVSDTKDERRKVVTIHQPDFLPWLGFFDRWRKSDLYIVLDDVQFLRRGWHHRDKIKTPQGVNWLTVPVKKKGHYYQQIREVEIDNQSDWRHRHLNTVQSSYSKAPNFQRVYRELEGIYLREHEYLIDLNMDLLHFAASALCIETPIVFASDYKVSSSSSQRLSDLVKAVGGTVYLTGTGSEDYLDETPFSGSRIKVIWQKFEHPIYSQLHGVFEPMLSVLDYLMMANNLNQSRVVGDGHA